ncbi:unnamed protein product [Acanthocheilonema viteae]|uniref:Uncharacterized protein n=1 Tax=Acanthocheilonema viteae TaxID=6277 RepID=A0A498S9N6_ACAVI|nr:unnamed protein product [Acanthocheilonema viteae]
MDDQRITKMKLEDWKYEAKILDFVHVEYIFSESKDNEEEISDIMEQLNNAAEKLTRLDAVKDLKLLQSEMETALKEISK